MVNNHNIKAMPFEMVVSTCIASNFNTLYASLAERDGGDFTHTNEHGVIHKEDGPARKSGSFYEWYYEGQRHNANGPAILDIRDNGCQYYLLGKRYEGKEYWAIHKFPLLW